MKINIPANPMRTMLGIEPKTTFWEDFSIADRFGINAVKDTYNRAFKEWKSNTEYLTEMVMVLNWKTWQFYEKGNKQLAAAYNDLYEEANSYALDNLQGEDLTYFLETTD